MCGKAAQLIKSHVLTTDIQPVFSNPAKKTRQDNKDVNRQKRFIKSWEVDLLVIYMDSLYRDRIIACMDLFIECTDVIVTFLLQFKNLVCVSSINDINKRKDSTMSPENVPDSNCHCLPHFE
jgi:hypothetical protein